MQKQDDKNEEFYDNTAPTKRIEIQKEIKDVVELQKEDYEKKTTKKKRIIKISILVGIVLFILLLFSIIFALININNDKIITGISINGIDMSGLSKEETKGKLETLILEKKKQSIGLKYKEYETEISPELIDIDYNLDKIVEEAFNVGRDSNIFVNNYNILFALINKKNIQIESLVNEGELKKLLDNVNSELPGATKESTYYIEGEKLVITSGTKGISMDIEDTITKIKNRLNDICNNEQDYINLKVIEKEPDKIDIDAIYKEVHKEAKDAYYEKEPFKIFPEVNGVDFNVEEAKKLVEEPKKEYTIKLTITKPKVTIDQIGTEAFPNKLSVFTTRYNAADTNRTTNLRIACQKIDGKVLLAGETFSYNKILGERTIAAGYKEAKVYENGQVVDGLGGGICQISSTLYNAVLMANLEIVERRNHQFVTSYLPAGRDATVVYGLTDFQFKNTRKYPIKIKANVKNGIATVEVYGMKEEEEYTITFETRTVGTIPFSTKYVDDATLAPGKEVVTQKGANGLQTETYIIKSANGKVVSKTLLSKDTYTAMQRIVRRSTKTENETTTETKNDKDKQTKEEKNSENKSSEKTNTTKATNTTKTKSDNSTN